MALSYYDPTDHHPVPARPVYPTAEALRDARILRGICSDADCSWPIDGWCVGCRAKLCERHLRDHHNQHTREYLHAEAAQMADDPGELAAHVRDDAGAVTICPAPGCGQPVADECEFCGKPLCVGGLFMHRTIGCTLANRAEAQHSEEA